MKLMALSVFLSTLVTTAAFATPETYKVDNSHTYPLFEYNHLGFSNQTGRFDKTSGKIIIDTAGKTGSVDITIDAKSINMGSAALTEHLQKKDFFDTEKYPTITYKSSKVIFKDNQVTSVEGHLTIKGITKPVTLEVSSFHCGIHPMTKKTACGANAVAHIKRSEFNLGQYVPMVSDEITLNIPVEAQKE